MYYKLVVKENDPIEAVNNFLAGLLRDGVVDALLVPQETPGSKSVVQTLVRSEDALKSANVFAPLLLTNSATSVGRITLDEPKEKIGAVLRSCEIRAAIELAKLKQLNLDNLVIVGVDCLGTYESKVYKGIAEKAQDSKTLTLEYLSNTVGAEAKTSEGAGVRGACQNCAYPNPANCGISINFLGLDVKKEVLIQIYDEIEGLDPEKLDLTVRDEVSAWEAASENCLNKRKKSAEAFIKKTLQETKDISGFTKELEQCRRCYNCRKECPICYCRECIFDSRTFEHNSEQYLNWANRKGRIRMPTDTLLFHLTRMNHMIISCVACGQCISACPNEIPIGKFFKATGAKVQEVFEYEPGRSVDEEIPQSTFKEDEFSEWGESK